VVAARVPGSATMPLGDFRPSSSPRFAPQRLAERVGVAVADLPRLICEDRAGWDEPW
jgi:hypothetical protein